MLLRVTQYGEPILRKKGKAVTQFNEALVRLGKDMVETMYAAEGIGLAAQQVNVEERICVVDIGEAATETGAVRLDGRDLPAELLQPLVLVNPEIREISREVQSMEEGCLSLEGIRGVVSRPAEILVAYRDPDGVGHVLECGGLFARCIQHEVDHLNGVLFIDHLDPRAQGRLRAKLRRLKRQNNA